MPGVGRHALLIVVALLACKRDPTEPDAYVFCTDQTDLAPTFTNVQRLFNRDCVTCHHETVPLDLSAGVSYGNVIGIAPPTYVDPPVDESCGVVIVRPGDPTASYLFQKISTDPPCAGSRMPLSEIGVGAPLVPCAQTLIHDWIAAGALND